MSARRLSALLLLSSAALWPGCVTEQVAFKPRIVQADAQGFVRTWWNDERIKEEGEYRAGLRHGPGRAWYVDGTLAVEGEFVDGTPVRLKAWSPAGVLVTVIEPDPDGVHSLIEEFDAAGTRRRRAQAIGATRDGLEQSWDAAGTIVGEGHYAQGQPDGRWRAWDAYGRLTEETWLWLDAGQPVGRLETAFHPEGWPSSQTLTITSAGIAAGWTSLWYQSGRQAGLVERVEGVRQGRDISWDETGRRRAEGRRLADLRQGAWVYWNADGSVQRVVAYQADQAVGGPPLDLTQP
ncbi:MAG: toxin-antitoxin system YwqK family antitoxin [Planctomycetota bacterium]